MEANKGPSLQTRRLRRRRYLRHRRSRVSQPSTAPNPTDEGSTLEVLTAESTTDPSVTNQSTSSTTAGQETSCPSTELSKQETSLHITSKRNTDILNQDDQESDQQISQASTSLSPSSFQLHSNLQSATTPSVNAVRVLFRDQQQLLSNITGHSTSSTLSSATNNLPSIVNANRRLIERQIAAIQDADSRRWNFDFSNCRPMLETGHRYAHYSPATMRNCRPLYDQNQSTTTRYDNQQQYRSSSHEYQTHSDHHKQDDV